MLHNMLIVVYMKYIYIDTIINIDGVGYVGFLAKIAIQKMIFTNKK
jgi:hypothetical protein